MQGRYKHAECSMSTLFMSYRREDSADAAGRIYDRLVSHFGAADIFKDVDCIPLGVDLRTYLAGEVGRCRALLAVIGRGWLDAVDRSGKRRLDDERDLVRIEIEAALARDIPVVPVLVQGASIPAEEQLPPRMSALAYLNGIAIRADPDFHHDMDRLIHRLEPLLSVKREVGEWMI